MKHSPLREASNQRQSLSSETIPLFDLHENIKHKKDSKKKASILNKYSISWFDVIIITFVCTINQLIFKSWFVFAGFVDIEYNIKFYELSWGLAVIQISAIPTMFLVPHLNGYKCNYLCLITQFFGMICVILNSILSGSIFNLFVLSFIRCFLFQIFWTLGNSIVFHFMQETDDNKPWKRTAATTIFMGSWTFSTVLFLPTGSLIDRYGFKETMFICAILNILATILLFYRTPAISLDDFIEIEQTLQTNDDNDDNDNNKETTSCNTTLSSDLSILGKNALVMLIMVNTLSCVTNWGMYYGSFGIWLQQLFLLNAQTLGIYVTICEAIAEIIALCSIPIISRYVPNSSLCIIGGICETSSVVILNIILFNNAEILNTYILTLDIEWMRIGIILFIIFLFYMGHEFLYVSLMVNIDIVPKKQHNTAVALYGVFDFTGAFIGQTFVTYIFTKDGMKSMAPIMLIVEGLSISCLISMNIILYKNKKKKKKKKENKSIMDGSNDISSIGMDVHSPNDDQKMTRTPPIDKKNNLLTHISEYS